MTLDIAERIEWPQWRARRIFAVTSIISWCALRKMECLRLWTVDVDLPGRVIWIVPRTRLKTESAAAPVPIPDALVPILEEWLAHRLDGPPGFALAADCPWLIPNMNRRGPWLHGRLGWRPLDIFASAAVRAGVDGATFQTLRRSWATHAEYYGLGEAMIQRVLRHSSEETSKKWCQKADLPNLREKVAGMTFEMSAARGPFLKRGVSPPRVDQATPGAWSAGRSHRRRDGS